MFRVAFLISGQGSNLQTVIRKNKMGYISIDIPYIISDNPKSKGIEVAKSFGIEAFVVDKKSKGKSVSEQILEIVAKKPVDLIVCAGFLSILEGKILTEYKNRIINTHPSLIPSFCGKGMYGYKVHKAVFDSGVKLTGPTIHFVDETIDGGPIIAQRSVDISSKDTPESIEVKVKKVEYKMLVKTIRLIAEGNLEIAGNKAFKKI